MNFLNGSIHHNEPQRKDENRLDGVLLGGRPHIASMLIGSDLTPADHADLGARWIDRELASRARLRRADSLTGGEVVGRKGANYSGTAVPPLCVIGWASPLLSAGVLFPNSAWFGIAATLALPGLLIHNKRTRTIALLVAGAASLFLNAQEKHQQFPNGWTGEMTRIHRPRKADDVADLAIEEQLQQAAQSSGAKVLVFPEGAVRRWTDATEAFWAPVVAGAGKTLLIGAVQPIPGSARYYNSVVIIGDHARPAFHQRIPVPGGMWNPFHPEGGVELNPLGPGTIDLGGQRAAILICYEQLLTWPMLRSAIEKPTVLVAISNESWTEATPVPRIQHACVRAWARLFGLPVISAINS